MLLPARHRDTHGMFRAAILSGALHGLCLVALLGIAAASVPRLIVAMPGTRAGTKLSLVYQPGGRPAPSTTAVTHTRSLAPTHAASTAPHPPTAGASAPQVAASGGSGSAGEASWGDANVVIAGVINHPRPTPDLATLPRDGGTIVLDALIDQTGHIAQLTVEHSLGERIDRQVLATVHGWTFTPATRDGQPIASEQDIVFHFDPS